MKSFCRKAGIVLSLFLLAGCGKKELSNSGENMKTTEDVLSETIDQQEIKLKNGEQIVRQITEEVCLDATVQIPDEGMEAVNICRAEQTGFDGAELMSRLLPEVPESKWEKEKGGDVDPEWDYHYKGSFRAESDEEDGWAIIGFGLSKESRHWETCQENFPLYNAGLYGGYEWNVNPGMDVKEENFSFASRMEAESEAKKYLTEVLGIDEVQVNQTFSIDYSQLEKTRERFAATGIENPKPGTDVDYQYSEEDNCYYILLEQMLDGIPLLSNQFTWQDGDVYIPNHEIEFGYTERGIEYVAVECHLKILDRKKTELLPIEKICETLERKYSMALTEDVVLDEMKLIYFPYPLTERAEGHYLYDLTPVWQFHFSQGEFSGFIYINALDGIEITG